MWDVFPDDMGLENSVESALAKLDLNEPMLEPVTFDDSDTVEGSSSILADAEMTLDTEEEDGSGQHWIWVWTTVLSRHWPTWILMSQC